MTWLARKGMMRASAGGADPYGPELIVGPPVAVSSGWVNNGDGSYTHTGNPTFLRWDGIIPVGKTYRFECVATGSGYTTVYFGGGNLVLSRAPVGNVSVEAVHDGSNASLYIYGGDNGDTLTISNLSLREVL